MSGNFVVRFMLSSFRCCQIVDAESWKLGNYCIEVMEMDPVENLGVLESDVFCVCLAGGETWSRGRSSQHAQSSFQMFGRICTI